MTLSYKNNFWGYFTFYYRIVGNRIINYLILSILISFMDGMGLAMFIPLLQVVGGSSNTAPHEQSLGKLKFFTDFLQSVGLQLNVTTVLLVLVSLFVLKGGLKYFQLTYYARLRQLFIKKIRFSLVDNLQGLSYDAFLKLEAGKIQNTLTGEVARLFQTMTFYFNTAQAFAMLSTYIILAFLSNYQFALLVGVGSFLSNILYKKIYTSTKNASIEISKKGSDFNSFLVQSVHYFKYLKATNTFSIYSKKLRAVINETEDVNRKIGYLNALATSIKEPVIITIVSLVIILQINLLGTSLNTIILSLLLFYRALSFLVVMQNYWQGFIEYSGGMHSVSKMLNDMAGLQEPVGENKFTTIKHAIEFKDVTFSYGSKKALENINLQIPLKQTVALIGESGSGKTTIANIIAGLFVPTSGHVLIDNTSLNKIDLQSYRSKIGYISQESVIFNDTIFNNITFWAEPTLENRTHFEKVLEMASLKEFVHAQPEKEQTKLGDNGILISGGQRQRISIARELYKNAEILILDEATSALDSETEKLIQENMEKLHGRYTMILIAHRLSTIKEADKIFLLEDGKISASGSFEEMIDKSTRFRKMVSLQAV